MITQFKVDFDRDYGVDKRTGWSVCINGSYVSELEKYLFTALRKAFYVYYFVWEKEYR